MSVRVCQDVVTISLDCLNILSCNTRVCAQATGNTMPVKKTANCSFTGGTASRLKHVYLGWGEWDHHLYLGWGERDHHLYLGWGEWGHHLFLGWGERDHHLYLGWGERDHHLFLGLGKWDHHLYLGWGECGIIICT